MSSQNSQLAMGWHVYGKNPALQNSFDVAVVMPTIGRESIFAAITSVYAQENVGSIQLLIGVDIFTGNFTRLQELLNSAPSHVTPCLFYPGYSTSVRHGGMHPARDGGSLRTVLSYLANARYIAYLDDDNWWAAHHLSTMLTAVVNKDWAFALRWFVHPESLQAVCIDDWESIGPGRGFFLEKFGGWVDPNCLIIDKSSCEAVLRWWGIPLNGDQQAMSADRHVFDWLQKKSTPGETRLASVFYAMQPSDEIHPYRLERMGSMYDSASIPVRKETSRLTAITTCKNRLHHLKQTLPLLVKQPLTEVIVVDYGCTQGTKDWVKEHYPTVTIIEVLDDPGFNVARARNIGAKAATSPWLLFIDADILVGDDFDDWSKNGLTPDNFYTTHHFGATDVSGTCFCTRQAFDQIGGYDEVFSGWGGEDDDLYIQLSKSGQQLQRYPETLFSAIFHSEDERFFFYPETNKNNQQMLNHFYSYMKYDLMATWGRSLSMTERLSLSKLATDAQQQAVNNGSLNPINIFLNLEERMEMKRFSAWKLERQLVYKLVGRSEGSPDDNNQSKP
jgi:hypothetical protein